MKWIDIIKSAAYLPDQWDAKAKNIFQRKSFLSHCELYNPCKQRYFLLYNGDELQSGAIQYSLRLDLFTYLKISSPITMKIIGIPCSVSASGMIGDAQGYASILEHICRNEKGLFLALNLDNKLVDFSAAVGRTLPSIGIKNKYNSWDDYVMNLRAEYRRRLRLIEKFGGGYSTQKISCGEFTEDMYKMYLQVYKRSEGKLEKLTISFFKHLPENFKLTAYKLNDTLCGWTITLTDQSIHWFFMGGQNYKHDSSMLYLLMLMNIVKDGIENKASYIDLGQTAEVPKLRFGGQYEEKYMLSFHTQSVLHYLLRKSISMLSYNQATLKHKVFK